METDYWHEGEGESYFRCMLCHKPVSKIDIDHGGCRHCGGTRMKPTNLTTWEKVKEIIHRPSILKRLFS